MVTTGDQARGAPGPRLAPPAPGPAPGPAPSSAVRTAALRTAARPLLTVVLPVGDVAGYLPGCLDSVLCQPGPPGALEVIAVDDGSADGSGAILDERAAADSRLRVIHSPAPAGPGPARMRGLAEAAGDYVWFVDPDDMLAPGCLPAVAERLGRDRPDVLLLDYLTLRPDGRAEPSHRAALLAADGKPLTLADRPALLDRTMTLWSKVIRRPFLAGLGLAFPPGVHEDVAASCTLLLRAGRIALLGRACYLYRQRPGSLLTTPGLGHFQIFAAYGEVFRLLDDSGAPVAPAVREAVFARAIEHYHSVLAGGLVPRPARRDFFRRMCEDFRRYRPPGYRRPSGLRGVRIMMIQRGGYAVYSLATPLNGARVAARAAARRLSGPRTAPPRSSPPAPPWRRPA